MCSSVLLAIFWPVLFFGICFGILIISHFFYLMPRKICFSMHRKNEFRKKRALKDDTKLELKVSVPLSQISLLTAATIQQLQQRSLNCHKVI